MPAPQDPIAVPKAGFPKAARLTDNKAFIELLRGRRKASGCLEMASRPQCAGSRLGVVVGRKNLRNAVERNLLKRIVREAFRLQRHALPPRDILVRLRQRLTGLPRSAWKPEVKKAIATLLEVTKTQGRSGG